MIFKVNFWNRAERRQPVQRQFQSTRTEDISEKNINVTKPVIYRLDGQNFECTISNTMADNGESYVKTFTEVRSTTKVPFSETRLPENIDSATRRYFEKTKPKAMIHVENRKNDNVKHNENIEDGLKAGTKISTRRRLDDRNSTYWISPTTSNVNTDDYDGEDTYTVSQRESNGSNNTYADDLNEYKNEKEDDFSDDKSYEINNPDKTDKNDTENVAILAAVGPNDANNSSKSDERDNYYKSKDGLPTVLVNNNVLIKFILSSSGRLLDGSPSLVMDNKTNPSVTLKIEKFTGDESTIKRDTPNLDMDT